MLSTLSWFDAWSNSMLSTFKDCHCSRGELASSSTLKLLMLVLALTFSESIFSLSAAFLNAPSNSTFKLNSPSSRVTFAWGETYCWNWLSTSCSIAALPCTVCSAITTLPLLLSAPLDVSLNVCGSAETCKLVV